MILNELKDRPKKKNILKKYTVKKYIENGRYEF